MDKRKTGKLKGLLHQISNLCKLLEQFAQECSESEEDADKKKDRETLSWICGACNGAIEQELYVFEVEDDPLWQEFSKILKDAQRKEEFDRRVQEKMLQGADCQDGQGA